MYIYNIMQLSNYIAFSNFYCQNIVLLSDIKNILFFYSTQIFKLIIIQQYYLTFQQHNNCYNIIIRQYIFYYRIINVIYYNNKKYIFLIQHIYFFQIQYFQDQQIDFFIFQLKKKFITSINNNQFHAKIHLIILGTTLIYRQYTLLAIFQIQIINKKNQRFTIKIRSQIQQRRKNQYVNKFLDSIDCQPTYATHISRTLQIFTEQQQQQQQDLIRTVKIHILKKRNLLTKSSKH
eukprot:TRINITY_DN5776_c1_g1_i1.p3 TRINITY_DN5776_c1_g1~~TRINITY_DN5776_c1_g1_i1.p3  ORF type:complete len:234 (-),score=-15.61 TRINITY_DN5776_c1_g1_i1:195-896(-)